MVRLDFKSFLFIPLALALCMAAQAQSSAFASGEELFRTGKFSEAISQLEKAVESGENPKAYIYLALCYQQMKEYEKGLAVLERGMDAPGTNKKVIAFDAGNISFAMGNYQQAENWYSIAIAADPSYSAPVLNRANTRLKAGKYEDSKADYVSYLGMEPETPQGNSIKTIISMLTQQMENEEKAEAIRVEQERKQKEEAQRVAAERARLEQEEAARRKKLLEDVASSLQDAASENMSAGAEGTVDYGYESELE
ncbi:MAG: tetratricopeptide repeat protein [Treponema sp.]|nr:tetratricopeptide repeat protein [Treponema sp.]